MQKEFEGLKQVQEGLGGLLHNLIEGEPFLAPQSTGLLPLVLESSTGVIREEESLY